MKIEKLVSLKPFNTFGIDVKASEFSQISSVSEFEELRGDRVFRQERLILGGGSNVLFTHDFQGLVIKNNLKGIDVIHEDSNSVLLRVAAGENWHNFVMWCVQRNFGGIENLSLIPGCVGAAPMQNIGAYGAEIKDTCEKVHAIGMEDGKAVVFSNADCQFGYRESIFKHSHKNQFLITAVEFRLSKKPVFNTTYGAIEQELEAMGIRELSIKAISDAVIRIRTSKLPDPKVKGNAGSFFKNPEVSKQQHDELKVKFDRLVSYPLENGNYKLAAGWLIEQCGLKGKCVGDACVHDKQALVLVNMGHAKGADVYKLSEEVVAAVQEKFGVTLEREVNIY